MLDMLPEKLQKQVKKISDTLQKRSTLRNSYDN